MKKINPLYIIYTITALSFLAIALYFAYFCQYQLRFMEQQRVFLFAKEYFDAFILQPGGIVDYVNVFLLQFFFHPIVGGFIISFMCFLLFFLLYKEAKKIAGNNIAFFLSIIPVGLLLVLHHDHGISLSVVLSLLLSLCAIKAGTMPVGRLLRLPGFYCLYRLGLIVLLFAIGGGVAVWPALMCFICYEYKQSVKGWRRYVNIISLCVTMALLYLLARYILYPTYSERDILFSNIPSMYGKPWFLYVMLLLWTGSTVIYLLSLMLSPLRLPLLSTLYLDKFKNLMPVSFLVFVSLVFASVVYFARNERTEMILHIDYDISMQDWDGALEVCRKYPDKHRVVWQYANLALCQQGRLLYDFMEFASSDFDPLFLPWEVNNITPLFGQETYYYLGLINESVHWAFEASIANPMGTNSKLLRRLVQGNIINGKYDLADKYLSVLDKTLYYNRWAEQMSLYLSDSISDKALWVESKRNIMPYDDFLMGDHPVFVLKRLLEMQPGNRMAFEYFMAYLFIVKDINMIIENLEYINNLNYMEFPSLLSQVLILYISLHPDQELELLKRYPISLSPDVENQFNEFNRIMKLSKTKEQAQAALKKDFGKTIWYYLQFDRSLETKMQNNENRNIY